MVEVDDKQIAVMYKSVNKLDALIIALNKAGMFDKADQAEKVINETRELLFLIVSTMHGLKNEISRLKAV